MAGLDGHLHQAQHRRVQGVVQVVDIFVAAVDGQGILDQIIGADAEKIHVLGQDVGNDGGGWNFHHDAHRDVLVKGDVLAAQFLLGLFQEFLGLEQLFDPGYHREHDGGVAVMAGPQDSTQLGLEDVGLLEAEADGAQAHYRVDFFLDFPQGGKQLVAAEVQGTDDGIVRADRLDHILVGLEMVLLAGDILTVEVEKFGAVQADTLGAVVDDRFDFILEFQIAGDNNMQPVAGDGRIFGLFLEFQLHGEIGPGALAIFFNLVFSGVDDQGAGYSVQDQGVAGIDVGCGFKSDHCRNLKRTGNNGRMGCHTADIRGKSDDLVLIGHGRVGR